MPDSPAGNLQSLSRTIRESGVELGFNLVKIAPAVSPTGFHPLLKWIANGYAADMDWIERRSDAYLHPDGVLPETRSVIVTALNYCNEEPAPADARISRYAWGTQDYHTVIKKRLKALSKVIRSQLPDARCRAVVDTAPLLERDFARLAGVGWFGKNTMLISREIGSWFFLGVILTTAELQYDSPFESDYCGSCSKCLEACPTDAFPEPGVLDSNRCISYLTIERRTKSIAESLRDGMGNWIFGCDICQEVCPWNRFAPTESLPEFHQRDVVRNLSLRDLLQLSEESFAAAFAGTPLERTGRDVIVRNSVIAAANQDVSRYREQLVALTCDSSDLVREVATWALQKLAT